MNILNTSEAAERLGISTRRVLALIDEGKLPAKKIGRDYAIEEEALDTVTVYGKPGRPPQQAVKKAVKKGGAKKGGKK
jgi:excisionase family DNA binding protein